MFNAPNYLEESYFKIANKYSYKQSISQLNFVYSQLQPILCIPHFIQDICIQDDFS